MSSSNWHIKEFDPKKVDEVAKEFKLPYTIAKIMLLRGITDRSISSNFFYFLEVPQWEGIIISISI